MATQCIDIASDKNLTNASPIAMYAFIICYIITNMFMQPDFLYVIVILIELVLCQVFFQFSPRMVFLTILFLFRNSLLSPSHQDDFYHAEEKDLKALKKVLKEERI